MDNFISTFTLLIGAFTLYSAFTGKGPAFKNDYPKEMQKSNNKLMRMFMWIFSPVLLAIGAIDKWADWPGWIALALNGLLFVLIVIYLVIFRKRYGKILKAQREKEKHISNGL